VLGQIGLLSETLVTTRLVANEGSLPCVHTEMVKKVVPLSEEHPTILVITFKYLHLTHCPWILVLEDAEFTCGRYSLVDLDGVEVEVAALLDVNLGVRRDLLLHFTVRNFFTTYKAGTFFVRTWVVFGS
jgi:hypothetical protein